MIAYGGMADLVLFEEIARLYGSISPSAAAMDVLEQVMGERRSAESARDVLARLKVAAERTYPVEERA